MVARPTTIGEDRTTSGSHKQIGILKCIDLVKFKTSIIMFKAYHNVLPDSLQKMFNLRVQI